jgi:DeoR/GlpR family transcriptional regulator of sugar metabolism
MGINDLFLSFEKRRDIEKEKKIKIAQKTLEFINIGEEIFLGAGTTVSYVGELLAKSSSHFMLKIWTNNIFILNLYLKEYDKFFSENFIGIVSGEISRKNLSIVNIYLPFSKIGKLIIGTPGFSVRGLTSDDVYTVQQVEHLIKKSQKIVIVADDTKIGRDCIYQTRSMRMIKMDLKNRKEYILITNNSNGKNFISTIKKFKEIGIKVVIV